MATTTYGATPGYVCNAGDSLSGNTCTHTTTSTYGGTPTGYSCNAGDSLSGNTCTHTTTSTYGGTPTGYSCNAGDSLSGSTCTHTTTTAATASYSCPNGGSLSGQSCVTTSSTAATANYSCPGGWSLSGQTCSSTTAASVSYSCNGWGTLSSYAGSSTGYLCQTISISLRSDSDPETSCDNLASSHSLQVEDMTWSGTGSAAKLTCRIGPTPAYSCSPGATRNGSQCITTQSASVSYSCPGGGTLSGNQCTSTSSQAATVSYSCSAGTLSGNQCLSSSTYGGAVTGYSCNAGDSLSGSTCTHTTTSTYTGAVTGYSCNAGDSLSGSTCTHMASSTYAASISGYTCTSGDSLSGSTCTHTSTTNATATYTCASGTLSGTQCLGVPRKTAYIYLGGKQIAEVTDGSVQYVHTDGLGTPVAHSNVSGTVINRARFEPYGYVAQGTKPGASTSVIGFTGHVQDAETDLVYMQQRYYDPIAGRFLSVDPVVTNANTGRSFALYAYVNNNPYSKIDPDGRDPKIGQCGWMTSVCTRIGGAIGRAVEYIKGVRSSIQVASGTLTLLEVPKSIQSSLGFQHHRAFVNALEPVGVILGALGYGGDGVPGSPAVAPLALARASANIGGGASLANLSIGDIVRIQNAANRTSTEISVVGSRAKGTAGPLSDWDFVVPESTSSRTIHSLKSSLPEGARGLGEPRNQDFFTDTVDPSRPFITFYPQR